jgi:hypothetical protein
LMNFNRLNFKQNRFFRLIGFALGIAAISFFVFHKKDLADSPPERPNKY